MIMMTKRQEMLERVCRVTIWGRRREMGHERMVENERFGRNEGGQKRMVGILFWLKSQTGNEQDGSGNGDLMLFLGPQGVGSRYTSIRAARDFGKILGRTVAGHTS